jgi:hypothetical protein
METSRELHAAESAAAASSAAWDGMAQQRGQSPAAAAEQHQHKACRLLMQASASCKGGRGVNQKQHAKVHVQVCSTNTSSIVHSTGQWSEDRLRA